MTDKQKICKCLAFGMTGFLIVIMMAATVAEKRWGTPFAETYIYGSPWFAAAWGLTGTASLLYLGMRRVRKHFFTWLIHGSLALILLGAGVTHVWGLQGTLHLRSDARQPSTSFQTTDSVRVALPFGVQLQQFTLEYYPGTFAPMDFVSTLRIEDNGHIRQGQVSMNHIYSLHGYRFYQSRYDSDGRGTTLSVCYDPWGIGLTYTGYALLLVSFIGFFLRPGSAFRSLWHHPLLRKSGLCLLFVVTSGLTIRAADAPRALPRHTAAAFGNLYVYYNDRICPLQTLAKDFTVKLCGQSTYKGLTPEQVLTGWFYYYDEWKTEPCIRIKSKEVRRLLGITTPSAQLTDFVGIEGYKLQEALSGQGITSAQRKDVYAANEVFSLVSMATAGSLWKMYPYISPADSLTNPSRPPVWYSLADRLPADIRPEAGAFIRSSMNYIGEQVARKDYQKVEELVGKIRTYQQRAAAEYVPSALRFQAEKLYNRVNNSRPLAFISVTLGLLSFIYCLRYRIIHRPGRKVVTRGLSILLGLLLLWLCTILTLRGIVSGYIPMSNGHETMQTMAATSALLALLFSRRMEMALPFGFLVSGLALLVSMMGESNPAITQLMPVLSSPLLSLHVMVIMLAYSLLAFIMLNGVTALTLYATRRTNSNEAERLQVWSRLLLYPAVFLLAIGIFIGAVWANMSWGRYWGWDPKEVWALITMLVYALALHPASLHWFRRPVFFHLFTVLAFFCVLITYFGVNFLLGGMHSYA